jgi:uncharacterized membrane protein YphA (DoxX/SURF4 family)
MTSSTVTGTAVTGPSRIERRLHAAAVVRIVFGVVWAIDVVFKWLPGFVHGQTLDDELGAASTSHPPVIHQWIALWHTIGTANPGLFAVLVGIVETVIAVCVLLGAFSNAVFIGGAIYAFGIWSAAEAFGLPWSSGVTDLGPSALYYASAGSTWSVDGWLRPRVGRLAWLCAPAPAQLAVTVR